MVNCVNKNLMDAKCTIAREIVELKSFIATKKVIGEKLKIQEMMARKMQQNQQQQQQQPQQQFAGRHPGCMWGVLHVLKYQRWRYIKKRLPQSRPSFSPRHSTSTTGGIYGEPSTSATNQTTIETQSLPPNSNAANSTASSSGADLDKPAKSIRSSVRSRLKSLISDELYRKKGNNHRRTNTCPVPQQQQQQQHNPHDEQETQQLTFDRVTLPSPSVPRVEDSVSKNHDASSSSHEHDQENDFSSRKELSEALDMAFTNKEFMATILQDPHSHFSPQFTTHKRYSKSVSFPSTTLKKEPPQKQEGIGKSKEAEAFDPKKLGSHPLLNSTSYKRSHSLSTIPADYKLDGISISTLKRSVAASINDTSPSMVNKVSSGRNKTAMRRLKDLKQKIRHVITMEAVLHKIPRGGGSSPVSDLSKDKKIEGGNNDIVASPRKSYAGDCCKFVLASKTENQKLKRTSSLRESLDKYCQLYDTTVNRDSKKNLMAEDPANMDINDEQIAVVNDDTTTNYDVEEPDERKEVSPSSTSDDVSEENKHDLEKHKSPFSNEKSNEKLVDDGMFIPEDTFVIREEDANSHPPFSTFKDSEQILKNLIANKLNFLEDHRAESIIDEIIEAEEELDKKKKFESKNNACYEVIEFQVDDWKEKEYFDYVKGILDISGFCRKEFLGAWHSNEQPLDPAVFYGAGGDSHLAMFDLINEVLMDIYAKSHTYCPKPLSWLSHIKPMPTGYHVLKEVWGNVKWSLRAIPDENEEHLLDFLVGRDFEKSDGWMNLQFDCECVGLELEDWLFDDILDELVFEDDPRGFVFL